MNCPFCSMEDTKVIDSRLVTEGVQVRRRRQCMHCKGRFTTYETVELAIPRVIKRNGARCAFSEDKLRIGVMKALEKRSVTTEALDNALARIIRKLWRTGQTEVLSEQIGKWVMDELLHLDPVAYIRFASVYYCFTDVDAFIKEVKHLAQRELLNHGDAGTES